MSSTSATDAAGGEGPSAASRPGWSVAARITTWYALSALLLLSIVGVTIDWGLSATLESEVTRLAERERTTLEDILRETPGDLDEVREEIQRASGTGGGIQMWVRILDGTGRTLAEADDMASLGLDGSLFPPIDRGDDDMGDGRFVRLPSGLPVRTFSAPLGDGSVWVDPSGMQVAIDLATMQRIAEGFRDTLATVMATGFAALLLVGYAIARRGLAPVRGIAATMSRIGSTTLHERVDRRGLSEEAWVLATAFNDVLGRLDASFLRLAQFSADIAHELRTPLARMRLAAEMALDRKEGGGDHAEALGDCLEEAVKLSRMIDRLLFLARAEGPEALPRGEVVDVGALVHALAEFYRAAAEEVHVALVVRSDDEVSGRFDRELLAQAIGNLLQNALAYTPAGGRIELEARRRGEDVEIRVTDTGCGIPAEHLPSLFDAFHRVDRARSTASGGTGLGLAIVRKIARLHGGDVAVRSTLGQGTEVTLTLPRDRPRPPATPAGEAAPAGH